MGHPANLPSRPLADGARRRRGSTLFVSFGRRGALLSFQVPGEPQHFEDLSLARGGSAAPGPHLVVPVEIVLESLLVPVLDQAKMLLRIVVCANQLVKLLLAQAAVLLAIDNAQALEPAALHCRGGAGVAQR